MKILDKDIQNIKNILEKDHGREFTWEEATQAMRSLQALAKITYDVVSEEIRRENLLKESPNGLHFDKSGYCCLICGSSASKENSWLDKYGLKCIICQKAINDKVIPGSITKNKESWYSKQELDLYFKIKGVDLKRYIKQSILKDRIIKGEGKAIHLQLFLIKDNKDVLPPKKLVKSRLVKVKINDKEYYTQEPWYDAIDDMPIQFIKKYKILEGFKERKTI